MRCPKCGVELPDNAKFCFNCGEKIEGELKKNEETKNNKTYLDGEDFVGNSKLSVGKNLGSMIVDFWNELNSYGKIVVISLMLYSLLFLVAVINGKSTCALIAIIQIGFVVLSIMIVNGKIKVQKKWISIIPIILSFLCVFSYISCFSSPSNDNEVIVKEEDKFSWDHIVLKDIIPETESQFGIIESNSENELKIIVNKTSQTQYYEYINSCKDKGFTTDIEQLDNSFIAYNELGYKLSLSFDKEKNEMTIVVSAPMELGNLEWPNSELVNLIPKLDSTIGKIDDNVEKGIKAYIGGISNDEYKEYVNLCIESGFSLDKEETKNSYSAKNSNGNRIFVEYLGGNVISLHIFDPEYLVTVEIKCVENWLFSKYNVWVSVDDRFETTIDHGDTETLELTLSKGEHVISFENEDDSSVGGETKIVVSKDEKINLRINCHSTDIAVYTSNDNDEDSQEEDELPPVEDGQIRINNDASHYISSNYQEAMKELKDLGFTNIKTKIVYDVDDGFWHQGYVDDITSIEINGNKDFKENDVFDANSKIVITYRDFEINSPDFKFLKVTVSKLLEDLDNNSAKARDYYGNKYVQVTGYIDSIQTNGDLNLVTGENPYELFRVQCDIKSEMKDQVMDLKKGDKVVLKGKITYVGDVVGYLIDVLEIVSPK